LPLRAVAASNLRDHPDGVSGLELATTGAIGVDIAAAIKRNRTQPHRVVRQGVRQAFLQVTMPYVSAASQAASDGFAVVQSAA